MKRFRFPLDSYLRLLRQQVDNVEARLSQLRGQQRTVLQRADELMVQRHDVLAANTQQSVLDGSVLASLDRWRVSLAQQSADSLRKADALQEAIQQATGELQAIRHRTELMERLRKRRLTEHRRKADREAEQIASELYLGNLHRRGG